MKNVFLHGGLESFGHWLQCVINGKVDLVYGRDDKFQQVFIGVQSGGDKFVTGRRGHRGSVLVEAKVVRHSHYTLADVFNIIHGDTKLERRKIMLYFLRKTHALDHLIINLLGLRL